MHYILGVEMNIYSWCGASLALKDLLSAAVFLPYCLKQRYNKYVDLIFDYQGF